MFARTRKTTRQRKTREQLGYLPPGLAAGELAGGGCGRGSGGSRHFTSFGWHREVQCHSELGKLHRADKTSTLAGDHDELAHVRLLGGFRAGHQRDDSFYASADL